MALDPAHLQYPHRRYGMDHDRYDWSMLSERAPVQWPGGASLALWVNLSLEFFPLNQNGKPFPPPGGMTMPYPDLRHYTLRDYGNRVGVFRCLNALERSGIRATAAVNGRLAERTPQLIDAINQAGCEILGHGWHMDAPHYGGQPIDEERESIQRTLSVLRARSGQAVTGWLSPGKSQSENTPDLLAAEGIVYCGDWVNDDLPYPFRTSAGPLVSLPLSTELEDRFILMNNLHSEDSYAEQIEDACDFLLREAAASGGGRLLALNVHPWLMGQPHRIATLERILDHITRQPGVWSASGADIVAHWQAQQTS